MENKHDKQARQDAQQLQEFFQHLSAFIVVNLVLLIIDLLSDPGDFWFYWVTLFWGIGLVIQAFDAFAFDRRLTELVLGKRNGSQGDRVAQEQRESPPASPSGTTRSELGDITDRASMLIDRMRSSARRIPNPDARQEALSACAASDHVLGAITDHPEEITIARDFLHRFLEPASTVISDYTRLANRNVPSAQETLRQVESHDLPLITHKANEVYDRLHRGTLIDLEVAREMLTLDKADTSLPDSTSNA